MWLGKAILTALPPHRAPLTVKALAKAVGVATRKVSNAIPALSRGGYVTCVRFGCWARTPRGDKLLAEGRAKSGPKGHTGYHNTRTDTLRGRAWSALRISKKATIPELLELAGRDERNGASNLGKYLRALERARIVQKLRRKAQGIALTSPGFNQWLLLNDLGPKAPTYRLDTDVLYDPNAGAELAMAEVVR